MMHDDGLPAEFHELENGAPPVIIGHLPSPDAGKKTMASVPRRASALGADGDPDFNDDTRNL